VLLTAGGVWAEDQSEKAARYPRRLLKRPGHERLYERFHDAWLDERTKEGLEEVLRRGESEEGGFRELWILAIYHQQGGAMRRPGWVRAREMSSWGDQFEAGISVKYGASRW